MQIMKELNIDLEGRTDKNGAEYYVTITRVPVNVDLSEAVFLIFPWEEEDGKFGAKLKIKKFEPDRKGRYHRGKGGFESPASDADSVTKDYVDQLLENTRPPHK